MYDLEGNEYCEIDPTWEEELQDVFSDYYKTFSEWFEDSDIVLANTGEELIPLMFVVSEITLSNANCETTELLDIFFEWINKLELKTDILKIFDERLHLYVDIIRNEKKPRYEWLMFNEPEGATDVISRCHAVFGDILFNPACADDYENAPVMIHDIFKVKDFSIKMIKFYYLLIEFCHKITSVYNMFHQIPAQQPAKKKQETKPKSETRTLTTISWLVLAGVAIFTLILIALEM